MRAAEQREQEITGAKGKWPAFPATDFWRSVCSWWRKIRRVSQRRQKRLRLCESLPLGERRFVAVVEFEQSRFLIGGTQGSLVLLAPLQNAETTPETKKDNARSARPVLKITPALGVRP